MYLFDDAFQSTRSQDRDKFCLHGKSNRNISIHSVARPRRKFCLHGKSNRNISIHSVARPRRKFCLHGKSNRNISIHSVARPRPALESAPKVTVMEHFNPLGRKTETRLHTTSSVFITFQSTRSQDRDLHGW